jgi:hypothetical protein
MEQKTHKHTILKKIQSILNCGKWGKTENAPGFQNVVQSFPTKLL